MMNGVDVSTRCNYWTMGEVTHKSKRSRETEDLVKTHCYPLIRQLSHPDLRSNRSRLSEEQELSNKNGQLWNCIKRAHDIYGGYIYTFKLKEEYDDLTPSDDISCHRQAVKEMMDKIYPAIEPLGFEFQFLDPHISFDQFLNAIIQREIEKLPLYKRFFFYIPCFSKLFQHFVNKEVKGQLISIFVLRNILNTLGYQTLCEDDGVYLQLPDRRSLMARWEKLREKRPELPPLDLACSKDIASDRTFIEGFFSHDALLSNGKEFVHDHTAHIIPLIRLLHASGKDGNPSYESERLRLIKVFMREYRRLMIAKRVIDERLFDIPEIDLKKVGSQLHIFEAVLSAVIDLLLSKSTYSSENGTQEFTEMTLELYLSDICDNSWNHYWTKRFGSEKLNHDEFHDLREQLKEIEKKYDATNKRYDLTEIVKKRIIFDSFLYIENPPFWKQLI